LGKKKKNFKKRKKAKKGQREGSKQGKKKGKKKKKIRGGSLCLLKGFEKKEIAKEN